MDNTKLFKMKPITHIFVLLFAITACDSPLSDVALTDPYLINASFLVQQTYTDEGMRSEEVSATLLDKNGGNIELKEGYVFVNDAEMVYKGRLRNYESDIEITNATKYVFDVVLADGESYVTEISTPVNYFGTVTVPGIITLSGDIEVSWTEFNTNKELEISVISYKSDGTWMTHYNKGMRDYGTVIIKNDELNYNNLDLSTVTKTEIRLTRKTQTTSNSAFRGGAANTYFLYIGTTNLEE